MKERLNDVRHKLVELKELLEQADPDISSYLFAVRDELEQYPELVHILDAEDIAPIYHAIMQQSKVQVEVKTARRRGKANILDDGRSVADLL